MNNETTTLLYDVIIEIAPWATNVHSVLLVIILFDYVLCFIFAVKLTTASALVPELSPYKPVFEVEEDHCGLSATATLTLSVANSVSLPSYGPRREKTCLRGFRQSEFQSSLLSYRD